MVTSYKNALSDVNQEIINTGFRANGTTKHAHPIRS